MAKMHFHKILAAAGFVLLAWATASAEEDK